MNCMFVYGLCVAAVYLLLCVYCACVRVCVCGGEALCVDPHPSFGCAWTNMYHMYCACAHVCM